MTDKPEDVSHEHVWSPGYKVHGPYWSHICEICQADMLTSTVPPREEQFEKRQELYDWWQERFWSQND